MPRFFVDKNSIDGGRVTITGEDAGHIAKTLRMRAGDELVLCDGEGCDYFCRITNASPKAVDAVVERDAVSISEPDIELTMYIAHPKSDKLELIVQKSVELGVREVCVFRSARCVANPEVGAFSKRLSRLNRIAREAAGQSGRGIVPSVRGVLGFDEMIEEAKRSEMPVFLYEGAGQGLRHTLDQKKYRTVCAIIGPEGGFSDDERERVRETGIPLISLGPRILRCETAAITAAGLIMFHSGNL